MDGGDWARSQALMVPRDTCRAANVRMRAQMSKEGGGVPGETGNATRKECRFATLGEAPWSRLISAQIGVERPLQFERTSPARSSTTPACRERVLTHHRGLAVSVKKKKGLRLEFDRFTQCLFGAIIRLESPFRASGEILCRSNAVPSDGIHGKRPGDRASAAWTTTKRRCSPDIPAFRVETSPPLRTPARARSAPKPYCCALLVSSGGGSCPAVAEASSLLNHPPPIG